jgi:hypothetical protein
MLAVAAFGLALAGSPRPASAAVITVDFKVTGLDSCTPPTCEVFGMTFPATVDGSFMYDTTKTGLAAFTSVTYTTGTMSWSASNLLSSPLTGISLTGDTVTSFSLQFAANTWVDDGFFAPLDHDASVLDPSARALQNEATCDNCVTITSQSVETTTPLPSALPLFATGIGGLGLLGWRRKRKAQAVA